MSNIDERLEQIDNKDVKKTIKNYPETIQDRLLTIREIIFSLASENDDIDKIEETLKWGEPSYIAKSGSTIRIAWKKSSPQKYGIYFNCNSKLIDTFKEIYPSTFIYEGNRAIIFNQGQKIQTNELTHCLLMALTYHKLKHMDLLGQ